MYTRFDGGPAFDKVVQRFGRSLKPSTLVYNKVIRKSMLRLFRVNRLLYLNITGQFVTCAMLKSSEGPSNNSFLFGLKKGTSLNR